MAGRLRIARTELGSYSAVSDDWVASADLHRRLQSLIRRHLSAATASLLAQPQPADDGRHIDWYTDLEGQPVPLLSVAEPRRSRARELLQRRLQALGLLLERSSGVDPAAAETLQALRSALIYPGEQSVYVVGDQPVITFWGYRDPDAVAAPSAAAAALTGPGALSPGDARGSEEGMSADTPEGEEAGAGFSEADGRSPSTAASRGGLRPWLFGAATLAVLALAILFLLDILNWRWPPWGPDYEALLAAAKAEEQRLQEQAVGLEARLNDALNVCGLERQLEAARAEEAQLVERMQALEADLDEALALCPLREQLAQHEDDGEALAQQVAVLEARLTGRLEECRARAAAVAAKQDSVPSANETPDRKPTETSQALPPCPGERAPEDAPDVVVVLDASGSMKYPATSNRSLIRDMLIQQALGGLLGLPFPSSAGPNRLDAAKKGINSVVRSLPQDVDVGLVVLSDCPVATRAGFFSYPQRGKLQRLTDSLQPMRKTPLASGVEQAAQMVDGVTAPAVVVVISDGEDTCRGNPCAVAQAVKMMKPKLTINVVDIMGDGASNCLATATGGKILTPRDGLTFEQTIRKAAEEAQLPAHCR